MYTKNYVYYHELRDMPVPRKRRNYRVNTYGNGDAISVVEVIRGKNADVDWDIFYAQGEEAHEYTDLYDEKGWRGLSRRLIDEEFLP